MSFLPGQPAHIENCSGRPSGCRFEEKWERLEGSGWQLGLPRGLRRRVKGSEVTAEPEEHSASIHKAWLSSSNLTSFHFLLFCYQKITRAECLEILPECSSVVSSKRYHLSVPTPIKQRPQDLCVGML